MELPHAFLGEYKLFLFVCRTHKQFSINIALGYGVYYGLDSQAAGGWMVYVYLQTHNNNSPGAVLINFN